MKKFPMQKRTLVMLLVLLPLLALFVYVSLNSGPLAPVPVTVQVVENRGIAPKLFGIGTVEARYSYKIGPTFAGRLKRIDVQVGDKVRRGERLGEMDQVDLGERIHAQEAAIKRAEAQVNEARTRQLYAQTQSLRYEGLLPMHATSEEIVADKKHDLAVSEAGLNAARQELSRVSSERGVLIAQQKSLFLVAPADGLISLRNADPGTTLVAGQAALELIDPGSLWVNVRFDQIHARGLSPKLPAQIVLRTQGGELAGRIMRVEPLADAVTEEMLAKVQFVRIPEPLPAVGEIAEVTVALPTLPAGPVIPNAAIQRIGGKTGVWRLTNGHQEFRPVTLGGSDLDGYVQVLEGIKIGEQVIVYSKKALTTRSRIKVVDQISGGRR